jgi:anti-sigma regulatory factor (Ser/Thr protein kinase)
MKDLSMHVMDIAQNSITALAGTIRIEITEDGTAGTYCIEISDNGEGMSAGMLSRVTDPFFTTRKTRRVGLGIPLLKMNCERAGGWLKIESEPSKGTRVTALLGLKNIDRPATGDMAGTIALLVSSNPAIEFTYKHTTDNGTYVFNTEEMKDALEGIPVNDPAVYPLIKEMLNENIRELKGD